MRISDWSSDVCSSDLAPAQRLGALVQEVAGLPVGEVDAPVAIEADDAGRHAAQHRLDGAVAVVELFVRLQQGVLLARKLAGHLVEGARQVADLVAPGRPDHPRPEVALADPRSEEHTSELQSLMSI